MNGHLPSAGAVSFWMSKFNLRLRSTSSPSGPSLLSRPKCQNMLRMFNSPICLFEYLLLKLHLQFP